MYFKNCTNATLDICKSIHFHILIFSDTFDTVDTFVSKYKKITKLVNFYTKREYKFNYITLYN